MMHKLPFLSLLGGTLILIVACVENPPLEKTAVAAHDPNSFMVVDCLLPGQLRKLGMVKTYLTARRAVRTTALDCEIRGGEYVAYDRANYTTSLKVWFPLAEQGDVLAQVYVGEIFEKGMGVSPDYAIAASWYRKAADQGSARAQISLGFLYERGLGVNRDPNSALSWYRKASGIPEAINLESQASGGKNSQRTQMELIHERQNRTILEKQLADARQEIESRKIQANRDGQGNSETIRQLEEQLKQREEDLRRQKQEMARLESEVTQSREQAGKINMGITQNSETIKRLEGQLQQREEELRQQKQEVVRLENEVAQGREHASKASVGAVEASETAKQLGKQLKQREDELQRQKQEVARLEVELTRSRAQMDNTLTGAVDNAPRIELIEPPVKVTRDVAAPVIKTRSGLPRAVVGRVIAPAGLVSLSLNNQSVTADNQGLFRTEVPVTRGDTPVEIVAVDKKGRTGLLRVIFVPESMDITTGGEGKIISPSPVMTVTTARQQIDFGAYYALMIGNNDYQRLPKLDTPINDVNAITRTLRDRYGFNTTVLTNANRYQILSELNKLREKLTEKDNLLIYYAGHGTLDQVNMRGYWQPVDAEAGNTANWISTIDITDMLNVMSVKEILIIADSCYSGVMTRSSIPNLQAGMSDEKRNHWLKQMAGKRSRTVLTSGGLGPVLDAGGGGHSVFSKALLGALESNNDILEGQRLYQNVAERVSFDASKVQFEQLPQYAAIKNAGHEAGDFFFVPK